MDSQPSIQEDATPTTPQPNPSQDGFPVTPASPTPLQPTSSQDLFDSQSEAEEINIVTDDDDDFPGPPTYQPTQAEEVVEEDPPSQAEGNEDASTSRAGGTGDALTPSVEGPDYSGNEDASTSQVGGTGDALTPPVEDLQTYDSEEASTSHVGGTGDTLTPSVGSNQDCQAQCSTGSTVREGPHPVVGAAKRTRVSDSEDELAMSVDWRASGSKTPRISTSPLTVSRPVSSKVRKASKGKKSRPKALLPPVAPMAFRPQWLYSPPKVKKPTQANGGLSGPGERGSPKGSTAGSSQSSSPEPGQKTKSTNAKSGLPKQSSSGRPEDPASRPVPSRIAAQGQKKTPLVALASSPSSGSKSCTSTLMSLTRNNNHGRGKGGNSSSQASKGGRLTAFTPGSSKSATTTPKKPLVRPENPPPSSQANSGKNPNGQAATGSRLGHSADRNPSKGNHTRQRSQRAPALSSAAPVFCEFPVIMTDLMQPGPARLRALEWKLPDILSAIVGPVSHLRTLGPREFLVGCASAHQQKKLLAKSEIGTVKVRCHTPAPKVEGVVYSIPTHVPDNEILKRVDDPRVKATKVRRLKLRSGAPSTAVHVTIAAASLPDTLCINKREYVLKPYTAEARRCYKCQVLGHIVRDCTATKAVCPSCGEPGHASPGCTAPKRNCVNCGGEHSAAYLGCPKRKELMAANRIRASDYMPMAQARQMAQQELDHASQKAQANSVSTHIVSPPDGATEHSPAALLPPALPSLLRHRPQPQEKAWQRKQLKRRENRPLLLPKVAQKSSPLLLELSLSLQ